MASRVVKVWSMDRENIARVVQEWPVTDAESADNLLVMVSTGAGPDTLSSAVERPLSDRAVDELLDLSAHPADQLLSEIAALDAAAERWRSALAGVRKAVEAQSRVQADAQRDTPLCEADDEYWYL